MSMMGAALLTLLAVAPPATADEVLAAHWAKTSVSTDRCGPSAAKNDGKDEEIVVCGRRESPDLLPLYDPSDDDDASRYGGNRVGQMAAIAASETQCAKGGAFCQPPATVDIFKVVPVLIKGIKRLIEGE